MLDTTAACATALTVLLTGLSLNVSRLRLRHRVSFGDGGHKDLQAAVRAHGNTLEQALLFMVLLGVAEARGALGAVLPWVALGFVLVRLAHAAALFGRVLPVRQAAHVATVLLQLVLAVALLA